MKFNTNFLLYVFLLLLLLVYSCKKESSNTDSKDLMLHSKNKDTIASVAEKTSKPNPIIPKNRLLGKIDYKSDSLFVFVNPDHSTKPIYLHKDCYQGFVEMYQSAKKDSIDLKIISGTRNFYEQKAIWERKWNGLKELKPISRAKKILEYSSMPSTSRHHWGTDIDLNSLNNNYFSIGKGKKEYQWLVENAEKFGFYQVYTSKVNGRTGYNEEKWHWSYLPVASKYLEAYNKQITREDINDFEGSALAKELNVIREYVNGVPESIKNYN